MQSVCTVFPARFPGNSMYGFDAQIIDANLAGNSAHTLHISRHLLMWEFVFINNAFMAANMKKKE